VGEDAIEMLEDADKARVFITGVTAGFRLNNAGEGRCDRLILEDAAPAEQHTAGEDQAGQAGADDGTGDDRAAGIKNRYVVLGGWGGEA
jgi:hypothetical protein